MSFFSKLFKKKSEKSYALALDIGTELVKALVFKIDKKERKGIVLGCGKVQQKLGDMQGGVVTNIEGVVSTCQQAVQFAQKEAGKSANQVVLGIAGELVRGETVTIHYERLKPYLKIDLKELVQILKQAQWQAFDKVRKQLSLEAGVKELDVKLINSVVVDVWIDGYRVTNPLGFQGKDVSVSIFNAYAPLMHFGALQTIADELELDLLSIAVEPYAMARAVVEERAEDFSAVFVDIGGGTTDLALVRGGAIDGTKMFALGGRAFTKRIASEFKISFSEAEDLKIKYSGNKLDGKQARKVKEILSSDCKVWQAGVELALSEFPNLDHLPSKILLCGGGSRLPEIKEVLEDKNWQKNLPFAKSPEINFVSPSDVINIKDKTGKLVDQQDITPMGLANLALELVGEESILDKMLKKAVKTIQT